MELHDEITLVEPTSWTIDTEGEAATNRVSPVKSTTTGKS